MKRILTTTTALIVAASAPAFAEQHKEADAEAAASAETENMDSAASTEASGSMETDDTQTASGDSGDMSDSDSTQTASGDSGDMSESDSTQTASGDASNMDGSDSGMTKQMGDYEYADLIRTRDITGGEIFSVGETTGEWSADTEFDAVEDGWNNIGEIEDIVLDKDGKMIGVVAEVGGFLDIGDKHVMVNLDRMRLVPVDNREYSVVTNMTEEELEQMEAVDEGFWE